MTKKYYAALSKEDKATLYWFSTWLMVKKYDIELVKTLDSKEQEKLWKKFLKSDTAICLANPEFRLVLSAFGNLIKKVQGVEVL